MTRTEVASATTPNETPRVTESLAGLLEPCDTLTYLPGNPRRGDVGAIARSLATFGQRKPVVARRGDRAVIAGNHTLEAARSLGWTELAVVWVDDDETTAKAYALADNRTAELGTYDEPALAALIREVEAADADLLAATAWRGEDLAGLMARVDGPPVLLADPDDVPEPPVEPVTQAGDLWLLGEHRLVCGDATDSSTLGVLVGEDRVDLLVTDPPYGIDYRAMRRPGQIANDADLGAAGEVVERALSVIGDVPAWFVFCDWRSLPVMLAAIDRAGYKAKATIVWDKGHGVQNLDRFAKSYELIIYGGPFGGQRTVDRDVWTVQRDFAQDHLTPKPVALIRRAIDAASSWHDVVLDPFAGSGTVVAACHETGRRARALELDPHYCDVICARYQALTGTVPVLERTGETHAFT